MKYKRKAVFFHFHDWVCIAIEIKLKQMQFDLEGEFVICFLINIVWRYKYKIISAHDEEIITLD